MDAFDRFWQWATKPLESQLRHKRKFRLFVAKPSSQYHLGAAICGVSSPAFAE